MKLSLLAITIVAAICCVSLSVHAAVPEAKRAQFFIRLAGDASSAVGYCIVRYNSTAGNTIYWNCHYDAGTSTIVALGIRQGGINGTGVYSEASIGSPWMGSWTPSSTSVITSLFNRGLLWVASTAAKKDFIYGIASTNGASTIGVSTTTFTYGAELTQTQLVAASASNTLQNSTTTGIVLVQVSGNNAYFYGIHTVADPTSMAIYLGNPDQNGGNAILDLCGSGCTSPYVSGALATTGTYLGRTVKQYLDSYVDGSSTTSLYGQSYIQIGSAIYTAPASGETRGQLSTTRTATNPYPATTSSSSSTGINGAASGTPTIASFVAMIIATMVPAVYQLL